MIVNHDSEFDVEVHLNKVRVVNPHRNVRVVNPHLNLRVAGTTSAFAGNVFKEVLYFVKLHYNSTVKFCHFYCSVS